MFNKILITAVALTISASATAAEFTKESPLTWATVQGARPGQPSTQNTFMISLNNSVWETSIPGSGTCATETAIIPAGNEAMRALALAAIVSGAKVIVNVDNTLPTVSGICQVTVLSIKGTLP